MVPFARGGLTDILAINKVLYALLGYDPDTCFVPLGMLHSGGLPYGANGAVNSCT